MVSDFFAPQLSMQPEYMSVDKELLVSALNAVHLALEYMPHMRTNVMPWKVQTDCDIRFMQAAERDLRRKLGYPELEYADEESSGEKPCSQ